MAVYRISGVWKDSNEVITHYAFHTANVEEKTVSVAEKVSKVEAIRLLETTGNSATTLVWNYVKKGYYIGEDVQVIGSGANKYLRSDPDNKLTDNLGHLIDFAWIMK